jgi:hypothetical protein
LSERKELLRAAIGSMTTGPKPLLPRMALLAVDDGGSAPTELELTELLETLTPNEQAHLDLSSQMRSWDHESAAAWIAETTPNTVDRRHAIADQLAVYGALRGALDALVPPYVAPGPVVITAQQVEAWYTYEAANSGFYWKEYLKYLKSTKGWLDTSALDRSTYAIVANVTNPAQPARYQAKGLVVGHVQSGKTANFTGVIARAADAGYRLVIVMTGTTNILRHQTQRRIDKELIGTEFVASDYDEDPDWDDFATHGALPSTLGSFDWLRLTGPRADYALLGYGGPVLDFKREDPSKPYYDPINLAAGPARIMVVKKHAGRLAKVAKDLRPYENALADVPVLVIDDESDQASLDTTKPNAADAKKRTAVNRAILKLLGLLPRAQYIGYTATPFANVFVNPDDVEDLFPRDFIVALDRPHGYMGAEDFHDLSGRPQPGNPSNEDDFVRSIRGPDEDPNHLLRALDSFVLAGGIKLHRQAASAGAFKHHTMLVHVSQSVDDHSSMHSLIQQTVDVAAYRSPAAVQRLRRLWEEDYRPVSARRSEFAEAESFEDLVPNILPNVLIVSSVTERLFSSSTAAKNLTRRTSIETRYGRYW